MRDILQQPAHATPRRTRWILSGTVQGVGFRPFIYGLATDLQLTGWVRNSKEGLTVEVEGSPDSIAAFQTRLEKESPPHCVVRRMQRIDCAPQKSTCFQIKPSDADSAPGTGVLPDLATCALCVAEIFDPANRRYLYPFTNCTGCGPRFSLVESLPYDRTRTSMRHFPMCRMCREEYVDPADRRFHAQPNACPECGPQITLLDQHGRILQRGHAGLLEAARQISAGAVVAVKGLAGFHLLALAQDAEAVRRLRTLKQRPEKPFAVMFPSLANARRHCRISPLEAQQLCSPAAPIVLVRGRRRLPREIAPGTAELGAILPYTPLHHLLLSELRAPVIVTSANAPGAPICTDEKMAPAVLAGMADAFLTHNRPIIRHADDSVLRIVSGRPMVLRRSRGFAPAPIQLHEPIPHALALGAPQKNSIALAVGAEVFISQHIGNLNSCENRRLRETVIADFQELFKSQPVRTVGDLHPDDPPSRRGGSTPRHNVQHHCAHVLGCMVENGLRPPVLGVAWDGNGYGSDGTLWGGEFFHVNSTGCQRVAHLKAFPLPGAEKAMREPRRSALGALWVLFGDILFTQLRHLPPVQSFPEPDHARLRKMLQHQIHSPLTSSVGRLFDAAASLLNLRQKSSFEGQAAMELESTLSGTPATAFYPMPLSPEGILDWRPAFSGMLADRHRPSAWVAGKFHRTLVEGIVTVAKRVREKRVVLSGGCFQNRHLAEQTIHRLAEEGFQPFWHQHVPPNDGGIALGQIAAAAFQSVS
jgi:hydrogenase maturation protein HypF